MATRSDEYEIRYAASARGRRRIAAASSGSIRHRVRRLANRARLYAPSVRPRNAAGALGAAGRLTDGVAIRWIRHRDGGFFLIRAGWELVACDVFPADRVVLVFAIASQHELAARLGIRGLGATAW